MIVTLSLMELFEIGRAARDLADHLQRRAELAAHRILGADAPIAVYATTVDRRDLWVDPAHPPVAPWLVLVDELTEAKLAPAGAIRREDWQRLRELRDFAGRPLFRLSRFDVPGLRPLIDALSRIVLV